MQPPPSYQLLIYTGSDSRDTELICRKRGTYTHTGVRTFVFKFMMDEAFHHMNIYVCGGGIPALSTFPFSNLLYSIVPNRFLLSVIWPLKTPKRQDEKWRKNESTQAEPFSPC